MCGCDTIADCSQADGQSYLPAWQYDLSQSYQVTASPQFHQREGSHSMDTLSAADSLCVLSLFHTASFIGKPAGLAALQLPCKSSQYAVTYR